MILVGDVSTADDQRTAFQRSTSTLDRSHSRRRANVSYVRHRDTRNRTQPTAYETDQPVSGILGSDSVHRSVVIDVWSR